MNRIPKSLRDANIGELLMEYLESGTKTKDAAARPQNKSSSKNMVQKKDATGKTEVVSTRSTAPIRGTKRSR